MNACLLYFFLLLVPISLFGQYAPAQGNPGSTAISKDSSSITGWATTCIVTRGLQNSSNPTAGYASAGVDSYGTGIAGSSTVSLGDGGVAILTFSSLIMNGPGNDFAVFENGFNFSANNDFLELAFVEVSSDGVNYFRFPSSSLTNTSTQVASFGGLDATKLNNLAGKYVANYGTPFDLDELKNIPGLNINAISHVKIIDVVGSIQSVYASYDSDGNIVNDPWPTEFPASGFDLDAVGVIHSTVTSVGKQQLENDLTIYPNPAAKNDVVTVQYNGVSATGWSCNVYDYSGHLMTGVGHSDSYNTIQLKGLSPGFYTVKISNGDNYVYKKIVIE